MFTDEEHMWVVVSSVSAFNGGEMFRLNAVVHSAISADSTFQSIDYGPLSSGSAGVGVVLHGAAIGIGNGELIAR